MILIVKKFSLIDTSGIVFLKYHHLGHFNYIDTYSFLICLVYFNKLR